MNEWNSRFLLWYGDGNREEAQEMVYRYLVHLINKMHRLPDAI